MPTIPQPRQKVEYKRPGRINAVSITLFLILGAAGYVGYSLWPALQLRASVKNELADALPQLWRLNLHPEQTARPSLIKLKQSLVERIRKVGVKDKKLEVVLDRGKERVGLEARFVASALFPGLGKRVELNMRPRVETDAARVEW